MPWFLLNYVPTSSLSRKHLDTTVAAFADSIGSPLEVFAPTFVQLLDGEAGPRRVERPLLYHYVFVRGTQDAVHRLCATVPGFSFVINHAGAERHITLSDSSLEAFRTVARLHGNRLPCFDTQDLDLQEGDTVQIVTGPFAGLTGTYITRKGAKSGNILIAVTQKLAVVIYDIKADYVRVLEFARDTKRVYDQVDAFVPRLLDALQPPLPFNLSSLNLFAQRFGMLRLNNRKLEAKILALLTATYVLLGAMREADDAYERYLAIEKNITNPWTLVLVDTVLGLSLPDAGRLERARALLAPLTPSTSLQHQLARVLGRFAG